MTRGIWLFLLLLAGGVVVAAAVSGGGAGAGTQRPVAAAALPAGAASAVFAGGCFWSTETAFDHMPGVISTTSGFSGGQVANPGYDQVVGGRTGHLEAVRVVYDPRAISYADLTRRFLRTIDPTDADGQFCDRGAQYRTAIFVANAAERRAAAAATGEAARLLRTPVTTRILASAPFYPAEAHHQDFARRNAVRYDLYRRGCGRDARLRQVWSRAR